MWHQNQCDDDGRCDAGERCDEAMRSITWYISWHHNHLSIHEISLYILWRLLKTWKVLKSSYWTCNLAEGLVLLVCPSHYRHYTAYKSQIKTHHTWLISSIQHVHCTSKKLLLFLIMLISTKTVGTVFDSNNMPPCTHGTFTPQLKWVLDFTIYRLIRLFSDVYNY